MRGFFDKLGYRLSEMMQGCYGIDSLGRCTVVIMIVFLILGFLGVPFCSLISLAFCFYSIFRCYSKNSVKRSEENMRYLSATEKPRRWFQLQQKKRKNKDTTCYFTCKNCGTVYSVPKGKGKIRTTCPKCHEQEIHTT